MSFESSLEEFLTQQLRSMGHHEHMTVLMFPSVIDVDNTSGVMPASKAAIAAMAVVEKEGLLGGECAICLTEYGAAGEEVVKEMPCKHRYHSGCIEKWLGIHGSCPVCRYEMPVDEEEEKKDGSRMGVLVINFVFGPRPDSTDRTTESGDEQDHVDMEID